MESAYCINHASHDLLIILSAKSEYLLNELDKKIYPPVYAHFIPFTFSSKLNVNTI
jgi:hypothetical protein